MRGAETKWQRLGYVARDTEMVSWASHFAYQEALEVIFGGSWRTPFLILQRNHPLAKNTILISLHVYF